MDEKVIKIVNEARWADGLRVRNRLEDITYDPMRSQEEFVMRMMREIQFLRRILYRRSTWLSRRRNDA